MVKVGIIGCGFVGGALKAWLEENNKDAKVFVSDDMKAVVGTINLDFRSLYHHFENAVLMYDVPAIADIKKDFEITMARSEDVTSRYNVRQKGIIRVVQSLLRLVAPLF